MTVEQPPRGSAIPSRSRRPFLGMPFDRLSFADVVDELRSRLPAQSFRYVVTPNVDHIVKLSRSPELSRIYDDSWLSLCDSKPVWAISRYTDAGLHHVTGSDLTASIFQNVIEPGDVVALVIANQDIADAMRRRFPAIDFRMLVAPPRVAEVAEAFNVCVRFLEASDARFAFIAIGAPQSELIAHALSKSPKATGTALCIGASLEFMVGLKARAPQWMRAFGLEWLHRLASEPRRLWRRYVLAVVPLARLVLDDRRRRRMHPTLEA